MLLLMCLVYGSFGMVSASLAPLIAPILRDLDMTRTSMGLVLGSWQFVYLFVAIPAGAAIDRFGLKRALLIGICFVALSQIIRAGATHQYILLAAVMVFGLGGPFISVGAPKLTSLWFPQKEVGSALGIYTVSPSFGSMIAVATANSLLMPLYDNLQLWITGGSLAVFRALSKANQHQMPLQKQPLPHQDHLILEEVCIDMVPR